MKIPRDISGKELIKYLKSYGYEIVRQTSSHIRLNTAINGQQHHITIPNHSPLKIGTLSAIITDIANYLGKTKEELVEEPFG